MSERETFVQADQHLNGVVDQIEDDQWDVELPPDFPTRDDSSYTLRQILDYQAYDEAWIPSIVAGKTIEEVGQEAFGEPIGNDLLGDDPKAAFASLVERSVEAVQALGDGDLDTRVVHYSYGDYPLREALWHAIVFRATRAYDFAKAVGIDSDLPQDLTQAVWDIVEPHAEEWRALGVFGPAAHVAGDAPLQDRLLGLTGRQP